MEVSHELENLGFTQNEIKVYLTLLRIGRSKAGRLAKECNLERTSVYNALKRLIGQGIVAYVIEKNERVFNIDEPEKILDMIKEKEERAKRLIPQLKELKHYERERESIVKYRGFGGIKTVFNDILKTCKKGGEYLIFGTENQLQKFLPVFTEIYVAKKDKLQLKARILVREGMKSKGERLSEFTEVRYVPGYVMSPANINVYKNKVAIFIWSEIPEAIIIDNKSAADSFRSYFEFMWEKAKK